MFLWCACVLFQCLRLVVIEMFLFHLPPSQRSCLFLFFSSLFSFVSVSLLRPTGRGSGWLRKMFCLRGRIVQRMRWVRQQGSVWHSALEREMLWKWPNGACPFSLFAFLFLPLLCNASLTSETFSISFCIFYLSLFPAKLYYAILNLTQQPVRRYSFSTYLVMSL